MWIIFTTFSNQFIFKFLCFLSLKQTKQHQTKRNFRTNERNVPQQNPRLLAPTPHSKVQAFRQQSRPLGLAAGCSPCRVTWVGCLGFAEKNRRDRNLTKIKHPSYKTSICNHNPRKTLKKQSKTTTKTNKQHLPNGASNGSIFYVLAKRHPFKRFQKVQEKK